MADKEVIVGVEVKYRRASAYGLAKEYVSQNKLRRLRRGLTEFLLRSGYNPNIAPQRIDVVSVDADRIEWLPNIID
jgi:putative endonuclease